MSLAQMNDFIFQKNIYRSKKWWQGKHVCVERKVIDDGDEIEGIIEESSCKTLLISYVEY